MTEPKNQLADPHQAGRSLRAILGLGAAAVIVFVIEDFVSHPHLVGQLLPIKLGTLVFLGSCFAFSLTRIGRRTVFAQALVTVAVLTTTSYAQMRVLDQPALGIVTIVVVVLMASASMPWPTIYQVVSAAIGVVLILALTAQTTGGTPESRSMLAVNGVVVCCLSIGFSLLGSMRRRRLRETQQALFQSEAQFRELAENSDDIIWIWSPDRRIAYISPAYERATGRSPDALLKHPRAVVGEVHPDDRAAFGEALEAIFTGGHRSLDLRLRNAAGEYTWFEGWGAAVRDHKGRIARCIGIWRDVTERVRLASTDSLTGLFNRRKLLEIADAETRRSDRARNPFSVLLIDIDHFKRINDTHGHEVGDQALIQVAATIADSIRSTDSLCRWGGEEFLVLLPETGAKGAAFVAEGLRQRVADVELSTDAGALRLSCTVGLAERAVGEPFENAVRRADAALYRGKAAGRNQVATVNTTVDS